MLIFDIAFSVQNPDQLVKQVIEADGSAREKAAEKLATMGPRVLPHLVQGRRACGKKGGVERLSRLIFELKKKEHTEPDPGGRVTEAFSFIERSKVNDYTLQLETQVKSGAVFFVDPAIQDRFCIPWEKAADFKDRGFIEFLDWLAVQYDVDWDWRYGRFIVSHPSRLWELPEPEKPKPLSESQQREVEALVKCLGVESVPEREEATKKLVDLGPAVLPLLQGASESEDPEVSARAKSIIRAVTPVHFAPLPRVNAWRGQKDLGGKSAAVVEQLKQTLFNRVEIKDWPYDRVVEYLQEGVDKGKITTRTATLPKGMSLSQSSITADHLLELVTLPYGLDARIEDGQVIIFKPTE